MSESNTRFRILTEEERSKINPEKFFVKLTVEFGPAANVSEEWNHEQILSFYEKHGTQGRAHPPAFHVLMSYLRDYLAFCWENDIPVECESPSKVLLRLDTCSMNCRPDPINPQLKGQIVYPTLCQFC